MAIDALAEFGPKLLELFGSVPEGVLRQRPQPAVWSALEYACHTGEAVAWYQERIGRVLAELDPLLRPFDWDAACVNGEYNKRLVAVAAEAAERACSDLAKLLAPLEDAAWSRQGLGSDGSSRSVAVLAGARRTRPSTITRTSAALSRW